MKYNAKLMTMTVVSSSVLVPSRCGVINVAVKRRNPEIKTQMSEAIWLGPSSQETAYLQIKNVLDKDIPGLWAKVTKAAQDRGHTITSSPDGAHYWVQADALKADKVDLRTARGFPSRDCEGVVAGAALGARTTGYNSNSAGTTLGVDLVVGLVGTATDAMVEGINYTMVTGTQISEKTTVDVQTDNVAVLRQDTSGYKMQTSTQAGNQHKYQTRIVSSTNRVNPKFEETKPILEDQLARSAANIP